MGRAAVAVLLLFFFFFFSSRRRHTRWPRDWSSDVCSSDLDRRRAEDLRRRVRDDGRRAGHVDDGSRLRGVYAHLPPGRRRVRGGDRGDARGDHLRDQPRRQPRRGSEAAVIVSRSERAMNYALLIAFAAFALAPILVILWTALAPTASSGGGLGVFAEARSEERRVGDEGRVLMSAWTLCCEE